VISLTLDAGGELPTPRLSRLQLHFGALAAADVVSQTLLPKLKMKLLLLRRWCCGRLEKNAAADCSTSLMLKVLQSQSCCKLTGTETAHQTAIKN
jgi:hypothetical protein